MGRTVAVVGGGCAGVLVTMDLLRCSGADVVLIEPAEPGPGLAYGTAQPWHLLNSRAGAMSADPDDPAHFVRWAAARAAGSAAAGLSAAGLSAAEPGPAERRPAVAAADFLSRRDYGQYLRETFAAVVARYPGRYSWRRDRATGLQRARAGWIVRTAAGDRVRADDVVLATGGPAASVPVAVPAGLPYVTDPWRPGALDALPADRPVLLVGTGLTAVDVALTLTARGDRTAPVVAVSRTGRLPQAHAVTAPPSPVVPVVPGGASLRVVLRTLRAAAREAGDWRPVVDGLRPQLDRLWAGWSESEQDRFLRHLARTWECHRHRMAPAVAARIDELRATGLLEVYGGGLGTLTATPAGLTADLPTTTAARRAADRDAGADRRATAHSEAAAGSEAAPDREAGAGSEAAPDREAGAGSEAASRTWTFAAVVNCAGPGRLPGSADPFTAALLATGIARPGPHGLGLDVDPTGRVRSADGAPRDGLWLTGPLRRGVRWETTAVPEIRAQARELAVALGSATAWSKHPEPVIRAAI